jgi:small-conductance mechanosensitive channel
MAILSRHLSRAIGAAAAALLVLLCGIAQAQQSASPTAAFTAERQALDQIEASLQRQRLSTAALVELGRVDAPIRDRLREAIARIEPQLAQIESRLKQLGAPPANGAPPEPAELAAERTRLNGEFTALDASLKQARLLAIRADQLAQSITERRYSAYARELFIRSWSILDPGFWTEAAQALVADTEHLGELLGVWWRFAAAEASIANVLGAVLALVIIAVGAGLALRRWRRWGGGPHPLTRFGRAMTSLWALVRTAVMAPVFVLVVVQVLEVFHLLPPQLSDIAYGLVIAVMLGAFGRGVAKGVLAPAEPERRLLAVGDDTARVLAGHLIAAAHLIALFAFLDVAQKAVYSPPILIALASIVFALSIAAVMLHLLFKLRAIAAVGDEQHLPDHLWLRGIAWLVTAAIVIAVLAGYARFADVLAERLLASIIIAGAFYLLVVTSDALFTDGFRAETPRARAVVANLGLHPRRVGLIGALLSGAVRLLLLLLAVLLIIGPWEGTATDLMGAFQGFSFGLRIGKATISFRAVLAAVVVLAVGILLTRAVQRWLDSQILPRTDLEPSLQQSVGMIFGYLGIIAAVSLALGALGIDLQKIALVAGALSVGIGFGLQSIVSNFVSGLILLTERPIRVGDWIVVKGEEGFVRRIRVRATEVETFERASVIVPNSDLITGVVKNWTHGNVLGRITVKVGVGYDSDPEAVRDILFAAAADHPLVLKEPKPTVLFTSFGDSALDFELRCIVRDIQQSYSVRSDLNFVVLKRFRQAGIDIPFPQRVVHFAGALPGTPAKS